MLTARFSTLKLQMQAMLLSTTYNSLQTVLSNLYHSFTEVAQKTYYYIHSLPAAKQPSNDLVISKSITSCDSRRLQIAKSTFKTT